MNATADHQFEASQKELAAGILKQAGLDLRRFHGATSAVEREYLDAHRWVTKAESDYKEFPDRAHFTLLQGTKIADYVLGWALCRANGSKLTAVSNQTDNWSVQLSS